MSENKLNPQIKKVFIGKRELKEITIYPLSLSDQLNIADMLAEIVTNFVSKRESIETISNTEFMGIIMQTVKDNIKSLLSLLSDELPSDPLSEITNVQLSQIVRIVYESNYEDALKNVEDLFEKLMKKKLNLKRSLQQSANTTHNTDSKTFTENRIETEA